MEKRLDPEEARRSRRNYELVKELFYRAGRGRLIYVSEIGFGFFPFSVFFVIILLMGDFVYF